MTSLSPPSPRTPMVVSSLIFDLDGTLMDSLPDITQASSAALAPLGWGPFSPHEVRPHVGRGASALLTSLAASTDPRAPSLEGPALLAATQRFMAFYESHVTDDTRIFPGIQEVLEAFGAIPLFVVSNKSTHLALKALQSLGIAHLFRAIHGGDAFERKKPDPLPLLEALKPAGLPTSSAVMIGDSHFDILAGRAAGAHTCGVSWGMGSLDSLIQAGADVIVHHPTEIIQLFRPV